MELKMYSHKYFIMLAIISGLGGFCSCKITCKSPSNGFVDWFIVYKVPKLPNTDGTEYFYMDQKAPKFSKHQRNIQSTTANPIYNTLRPLYSKSKTLQKYGMYNDQPPVGNAAQSYGHSKGTFAFGKDSGFWIISSVPCFPAAVPKMGTGEDRDAYVYNDSQTKKGQIIFCVTLGSELMNPLGKAFNTTNPYIYDNHEELPSVEEEITYCTSFHISNTGFALLAKSSSFGGDLYRDLIRVKLDDSLYVQSWQPNLTSDEEVTDVKNVCFEKGLTFSTGLDHSKWAVAKHKPWTCIAKTVRERWTSAVFKK